MAGVSNPCIDSCADTETEEAWTAANAVHAGIDTGEYGPYGGPKVIEYAGGCYDKCPETWLFKDPVLNECVEYCEAKEEDDGAGGTETVFYYALVGPQTCVKAEDC